MSSIVKSFGDKTPQQIEQIGLSLNVTWPQMKQYIGLAVGKAPYEDIEGIVIDDTGITVKLSRQSTAPPNQP